MSRELEVSAEVVENSEFDEILRVWIGSDAVVTMQDLFGPNAHNWGMVLADVGNAHSQDETGKRWHP
ncbi:DUF5076 domain-containing protein [Mesorhizobium sp. M0938]|uniref:DUF5076 domain-containing protein n=1 Tax=unclassified Mesorhizobium TaxID=325217 RepID=UPI003339E309